MAEDAPVPRSLDPAHRPLAPLTPFRRWWGATLAAMSAASLAGSAMAAPQTSGSASSVQLSRIGRICATVIRVEPGDPHYVGCVESLSDSLRRIGGAARVDAAGGDYCWGRGVRSDGADAPLCVLSTDGRSMSSRSYYYASNDEVRRRAQLSCGLLGFDPANSAFTGCAASLSATLEEIDLPPAD